MERKHTDNTFDVDVDRLPSTGITREQYLSAGGVALKDGQAIKAHQAFRRTMSDNEDNKVDWRNEDLLEEVKKAAHKVEHARQVLGVNALLTLIYDAKHGIGAWSDKMSRWQQIYNGDAEPTEADLADTDYGVILGENASEMPCDYTVESQEDWIYKCRFELDQEIAKSVEHKDENLDAYIRNAIRDAKQSGIEINHEQAVNV